MRVVCDTGPLVAATDRRDPGHDLAAALVSQLGRDLLVPDPVVVETDYMLRTRYDSSVARVFLLAISAGEHQVQFLTPGLLRRAIEFDSHYADLNLGLADGSVMAIAERHDLPILTFDFGDFRATTPEQGYWRLVIDEARYREATKR